MPYENQEQDIELDPKKLKFGMSKAELKELEQQEKAKRKKITKAWKPTAH